MGNTENVSGSRAKRAGGSGARPAVFPCDRCPLDGRHHFETHTREETNFLLRLKKGEFHAESGDLFLHEGETSDRLFTVLSGWGFRSKMLPDGRRQIMNYVMPGDFVGLQATLFGRMQHSVQALSPMLLCFFGRQDLRHLYEEAPSLAYDITWLASREEQILEEHLLSVGRRSAVERAAYLVSFLHQRGLRTGVVEDGGPLEPFTQTHVADTLGLSLVHTNKTLRKLQREGVVRWSGKSCYVQDAERLKAAAAWQGLPDADRAFI